VNLNKDFDATSDGEGSSSAELDGDKEKKVENKEGLEDGEQPRDTINNEDDEDLQYDHAD